MSATTPMHDITSEFPRTLPSPGLETVDRLLRDRTAVLQRIENGRDLAGFARAMILTIAAGGAMFGAAAGAHRGGIQIAFAAIKLPLVILFTAAVCAPALTALNAALERPADVRRDLSLILGSLGLGSLVLSALAPMIFLAVMMGCDYHQIFLMIVGCCAIGGTVGITLLARGIFAVRKGAFSAMVALGIVFAMVGCQMSWTGRPYLVRPQTTSVPFIRPLDGEGFLDSVLRSFDSSRGIYSRDGSDPESRGTEL